MYRGVREGSEAIGNVFAGSECIGVYVKDRSVQGVHKGSEGIGDVCAGVDHTGMYVEDLNV